MFADALPFWTGQAMASGSNPGSNLISRFSIFKGLWWDGVSMVTDNPQVFGHSLRDLSENQLRVYFDLYNVQSVAAWSKGSNAILQSYPDLLREYKRLDSFRLYTVRHPGSWMKEGTGAVSFDYDQIRVARASRGPLVLKFHWIDTLACSPPLPLSPVRLADDPVPYIKVDNSAGATDILIYNKGLPLMG
jgi:hypothetical protein